VGVFLPATLRLRYASTRYAPDRHGADLTHL
jgi:hypothetical protein